MTGRHRATAAEQRVSMLEPGMPFLSDYRHGQHSDTERPIDWTVNVEIDELDPRTEFDNAGRAVADIEPPVPVHQHVLRRWLYLIENSTDDTTRREIEWEIRDALGLPNDDERTA